MGTLLRAALKAIGIRGLIVFAALVVAVLVNLKVHTLNAQIEADQQSLALSESDKKNLQSEVQSQSARADQAQENADLISREFEQQKAAAEKYHQQLTDLRESQEKKDEQTQNTIKELHQQLVESGISDVAVPAGVVRVQRQAVCTANNSCQDSDRDAGKGSPKG